MNMAASSEKGSAVDAFLRCIVSVLSTVSLVLLARSQQTSYQLTAGDLVPIHIEYSYVAGLVFHLYANGVVAGYSFLVALSSASDVVTRMRGNRIFTWIVFVLDQALAYLLMSAVSAATEVFYLTKYGNDKSGWDVKCGSFGKFCNLLLISIALSLFSVILSATISILSAKDLFKHYVKLKLGKSNPL